MAAPKRAEIPAQKLADARRLAGEQIANRDRRDQLLRVKESLRAAGRALWETHPEIERASKLWDERRAAVADGRLTYRAIELLKLVVELQEEQFRTDGELLPYEARGAKGPRGRSLWRSADGAVEEWREDDWDGHWKECARDGEDLTSATARVLSERGASANRVAVALDIDPNSRRRKDITEMQKARASELQREIDEAETAIAQMTTPAPDDEFGITVGRPLRLEVWRDEAIQRVHRLSDHKKTPSRKRRTGGKLGRRPA